MNIIKKEQLDNLMQRVIRKSGTVPIYNCILTLNNNKKGFYYDNATGTIGESNEPITSDFSFRTGSITKTFTSVIILQLMEEGFLNLHDKFLDRLTVTTQQVLSEVLVFEGVNYSREITIQHLLEHRSGLRDFVSDDERFFKYLISFPKTNWNWKMVMKKYFEYDLHKKAQFKPNNGYHYADTNYLLLAVLIEELTKETFHEVLQKKIIAPLQLQNTYLEYHQKATVNSLIAYPFNGVKSLENINTSFDWGAGGLISTAKDLDIFISALLTGKLFQKKTTLKKIMKFEKSSENNISDKRENLYGLGLNKRKIAGLIFFGHASAYGAMMFYEPVNNISIILSINQALALHKAEWLLNKAIEEYISLELPN